MNRITNIILFLFLSIPLFAQKNISGGTNDFEYYRNINNTETRLSEFKDNDEALEIKLTQIAIINKSRKKHRASPVRLDILASRVANKMCIEAAENEYLGHWNMATFMAERSPHDGHKKNIIDKSHNYVGIGFYLKGNQFRYYEEFIDRYFEFENIPASVKIGEPCSITVKPNNDSFIYFMIIYREKFPSPMTPAQIGRKGSYEDYTNETYLRLPAWDIAKYRDEATYEIPLTFSREGLYYIHLYYDKKEIVKPASLSTKGKTPVSGIIVTVN